MKNKGFSIIGLLKLTRIPNLLIIAVTQYLAVIFLVYEPGQLTIIRDPKLFLLVLSTLMIAAAGYIINDYYDVKIDYVNKPDRVVVGKLIRRRLVLAVHFALNFTGIAIGFFLDFKVGILNLFSSFLLWIYSNRLKQMPLAGNLVIAFLTGLTFFVIWIFYHTSMYLLFSYAIFAFAITLIREIIKDMEDMKGDAKFGSRTLPIIWGIRKTKQFLYALILLSGLLFFFLAGQLNNPVLNNFFLILIIPAIYLIYLLYRADTQKRYNRLSLYCKLIMLAGIYSITLF
jgi:4-hydroxybenzoate polyprenyltransferase